MGLFDKKKKGRDDFDSPVEQIDLSSADAGMGAAGADQDDADEAETVERGSGSFQAATQGGPPAPPPARRVEAERPRRASATSYGIDDAIALMRTLPADNVELVVQVVKHTLESARIDITAIIDDASGKQERIESRVKVLRDAIADLEREISTRRTEIDQLETDHRETTKVKERLVLAEKLTQGSRPSADNGAVESSLSGVSSQRSVRATDPQPGSRSKPNTSPPPLPGVPVASHGTGSHSSQSPAPSSAGPGGPAVGSAVGPGGPAGTYSSHKSTPTHTVIPKK
jgi:hypothetical protein